MLLKLLLAALAIGQSAFAWPSAPAPTETLDVLTTLPDRFRRPGGMSEHSINQKRGRPLDSFLEGPLVIGDDLFVTDIPYGRVFKVVLNSKNWTLVAEYDGEPNGLVWHAQRRQISLQISSKASLGWIRILETFRQFLLAGMESGSGDPTIWSWVQMGQYTSPIKA